MTQQSRDCYVQLCLLEKRKGIVTNIGVDMNTSCDDPLNKCTRDIRRMNRTIFCIFGYIIIPSNL